VRLDFQSPWGRALRTCSMILLSATLTVGCTEDGVTLPEEYNTQRFREIVIDTQSLVDIDGKLGTATMRPMNGMHGSPLAIVPEDPDLTDFYWGRSTGSDTHDGAHVSLVRLGTGTDCRVSLEGLYDGGTSGTEDEESYSFQFLDHHVQSIEDLNTSEVMWQAALAPDAQTGCNPGPDGYQQRTPLKSSNANTIVRVAFNTLRHLRNDGVTAGFGSNSELFKKLRWVEFMDDPSAHMGYSSTGDSADGQTDYTVLFNTYGAFAKLVKDEWPAQASDGRPVVAVGGISFTLNSPEQLKYLAIQDAHPILRFIDHCATNSYELDFLSFKTKTTEAAHVGEIAQKLSDFLQTRYPEAVLILTGVDVDETVLSSPAALWVQADQRLTSSFVGAFQSAARIYAQDVSGNPVAHMVAGRGSRVLKDLIPHQNDSLESLYSSELLTRSDYFAYLHAETNPDLSFQDDDGEALGTVVPLPSFMNLFPFRQVTGHQRVEVTKGTDGQGMAVVATHDPASTDTLHVIIANSNIASGTAQILYEIELADFLPATVEHVEYKFATLNHNSFGISSFHFSETGIAETVEGTGNVRFVHEMAIPSVHYIQFIKPTCDPSNPCSSGYSCWSATSGGAGYCIPNAPTSR
jgi:hypothetical protein